mmetsp:Transcript_16565/g.45895  ORF Transcript_16565/g.45895 Transcript_16565/m.45895 type:complete len:257 (-) Transcript_16565:371-1141(-)
MVFGYVIDSRRLDPTCGESILHLRRRTPRAQLRLRRPHPSRQGLGMGSHRFLPRIRIRLHPRRAGLVRSALPIVSHHLHARHFGIVARAGICIPAQALGLGRAALGMDDDLAAHLRHPQGRNVRIGPHGRAVQRHHEHLDWQRLGLLDDARVPPSTRQTLAARRRGVVVAAIDDENPHAHVAMDGLRLVVAILHRHVSALRQGPHGTVQDPFGSHRRSLQPQHGAAASRIGARHRSRYAVRRASTVCSHRHPAQRL